MENNNVGIDYAETYYMVIIDGEFEDGSQISMFLPNAIASFETIEREGLEQKAIKLSEALKESAVASHIRGLEKLHDNNGKIVLVKYFIQKIKKFTSCQEKDWTAFLEKKLICTKSAPATDSDISKNIYYVYKHYYFDENGDEIVFYIGKGTGDAKGGCARIYSHYRNKYWEEIVKQLDEKEVKYYFEPIKFFEIEKDALTYELELQKEYWEKGQCLGCADLRRRYGDPKY